MVPEGRSDPCKALEEAGRMRTRTGERGIRFGQNQEIHHKRRRHPGGTDATVQELLASQRCLSHGGGAGGGEQSHLHRLLTNSCNLETPGRSPLGSPFRT